MYAQTFHLVFISVRTAGQKNKSPDQVQKDNNDLLESLSYV